MIRLKIKIFNREICVCALQSHNGLHKLDMRKKQRRNGENYESKYRSLYLYPDTQTI